MAAAGMVGISFLWREIPKSSWDNKLVLDGGVWTLLLGYHQLFGDGVTLVCYLYNHILVYMHNPNFVFIVMTMKLNVWASKLLTFNVSKSTRANSIRPGGYGAWCRDIIDCLVIETHWYLNPTSANPRCIQYSAVITWSIFCKIFTTDTPELTHKGEISTWWLRGFLSFVILRSDLCFAPVIVLLYAISWHIVQR